jgi:hypothetical protein
LLVFSSGPQQNRNSNDFDRCSHLPRRVYVPPLQLFADLALVLAVKLHLIANLNLHLILLTYFHRLYSFVLRSFPQSLDDLKERRVVQPVSYQPTLPLTMRIKAPVSSQGCHYYVELVSPFIQGPLIYKIRSKLKLFLFSFP